jgi:hypothetical protein
MLRYYSRFLYYKLINFFILFNFGRKNFHSYNVIFTNYENLFNNLCIKYGTDKGFKIFQKTKFLGKNSQNIDYCYPHIYSKFYNDYFFTFRKKIKFVFECGIGDKTSLRKFSPGASLKVWKDFFPNAKIYGADINKNLLFNDKRIRTYFVDQNKKSSIISMWKKINHKFDVIVDDGLHNFNSNINFFNTSFKYLKEGGVYFIEDVQLKNTKKYKEYFNNKKILFEIIYFENLNYSNHCIIKIIK